jgi:hypothetical protein
LWGELQHVREPQGLYDDDVEQAVLGVCLGGGEPATAGVAAVADDHVDRPHLPRLAVEVQLKFAHVEIFGDLQRGPQVRELAPPLLELPLVGVGDLRPESAGRHVDKEPLPDPVGSYPRHVERPHPTLAYDVLRPVRVVGDAQGRREIVAGPGGQDTQGDTFGKTCPA